MADTTKKFSYDGECYQLAEHFLPYAEHAEKEELAQLIQDAVERHFSLKGGSAMADTKQATHGFKPSIHAKTCPEFRQKANAENDGCVQDSAFPCNCGAGELASRSGPDRTPQARAREWLDAQDIQDRSSDKTWYGIGADKIAALLTKFAIEAGPDRGQQDAPDDEHICDTPNYTDGPCYACAKEKLMEWVFERYENCQRIAKLRTGIDSKEWLDDADHFMLILTLLRGRAKAAWEGQAPKGDGK